MTVWPLYAFVEGDTMGVVVLGRSDGSSAELAEKLIAAVSVRVARRARYRLVFEGQVLDPGATLRMLGLRPLGRVDLVWD